MVRMAMTPAYALAHVFLPNLLKLKGHATVVAAIERRDLVFFDPLWGQAHVTHRPHLTSQTRTPYRIATLSLPAPSDVGEAYMAGIVIQHGDPAFLRYFTLELEHVVNRQNHRTMLCEREGQRHIRRGEGPALTGNTGDDARMFVESFMELIVPTRVMRK